MSDLPVLEPRQAYALWADGYPPRAHNPLMQAEERAMLSLLPVDMRGLRVLDAGCGSGRYLSHALERGASAAIGVDLSPEMLRRARRPESLGASKARIAGVVQGDLTALPLRSGWADVAICGLAVGHVRHLTATLAELRRVTRPGGLIVCSDFHPIGAALGWTRDFKAGGKRYAVRHTTHFPLDWHDACLGAGLCIDAVSQPRLDPADVPAGAHFDPQALEVPVAVVYALRIDRLVGTRQRTERMDMDVVQLV